MAMCPLCGSRVGPVFCKAHSYCICLLLVKTLPCHFILQGGGWVGSILLINKSVSVGKTIKSYAGRKNVKNIVVDISPVCCRNARKQQSTCTRANPLRCMGGLEPVPADKRWGTQVTTSGWASLQRHRTVHVTSTPTGS